MFCVVSTFFILSSCSNQNSDDFLYEGEAVSRQLTFELKQIRARDDLLVHAPRLQELFDRLVDVMIQAQVFKDSHSHVLIEKPSLKEKSESDSLRIELNRVLHMEGGKEVIEKAQEASLNRLDAFEKMRLHKTSK